MSENIPIKNVCSENRTITHLVTRVGKVSEGLTEILYMSLRLWANSSPCKCRFEKVDQNLYKPSRPTSFIAEVIHTAIARLLRKSVLPNNVTLCRALSEHRNVDPESGPPGRDTLGQDRFGYIIFLSLLNSKRRPVFKFYRKKTHNTPFRTTNLLDQFSSWLRKLMDTRNSLFWSFPSMS